MKKRISMVANFFAFNLLFFALYLNFIHKDSNAVTVPGPASTVKGTVLVTNPEQYLQKQEANKVSAQYSPNTGSNTAALKLSFN